MDCPRCENDVDGTATFCPECGLNFEELRQNLGLPQTSPRPTDVILMKADWQTVS